MYAAAAVLDHHEHIEAAQKDGVDVGEVDREDRLGLRGQELSPGRPGPARSGIDPGGLQRAVTVSAERCGVGRLAAIALVRGCARVLGTDR